MLFSAFKKVVNLILFWLLNLVINYTLKKLLKIWKILVLLFIVRGKKIIVMLWKGYENFLSYFVLCVGGTEPFKRSYWGI